MQTELLTAILAGVGAMLGWGLADFFAKKTIDKIGAIPSLVWAHLFGTIALITIVFYKVAVLGGPFVMPSNFNILGLLVFFGALQAVVYWLAYEGFGKGQISILNPVFASYSGVAALVAIVLFGEILTAPLIISLLVIFVGILMLNLDPQALQLKKLNLTKIPGLKEVGLAALFAAFWTVGWAAFVEGGDWLSYAMFMYAFMTLTAFLIAKFKKIKLSGIVPDAWKYLVLIGLCEIIAYLSISLGFSSTSYVSVVALISGAFSLPTILLARIFLKEKVTRIQTIGTLVIVAGIVILSLR